MMTVQSAKLAAGAIPAGEPILEMRGISQIFPGVKALDRVDIALYPGKVTALIGENGAGKSTLVKILTGIYRPNEGEILIVVALDERSSAPRLRIAVQDSGEPMDAEERELLMHAELHSKNFLAATRLGGNLGLVIARRLVLMMQGEFGVKCGSNRGSSGMRGGGDQWRRGGRAAAAGETAAAVARAYSEVSSQRQLFNGGD